MGACCTPGEAQVPDVTPRAGAEEERRKAAQDAADRERERRKKVEEEQEQQAAVDKERQAALREKLSLEMDAARVEQGIPSDPLDLFFAEQEAKMFGGPGASAAGQNPFAALGMLGDNEKMEEAWIVGDLRRERMEKALRAAFPSYDKNSKGSLEEHEGKQFFNDYMCKFEAFQYKTIELGLKQGAGMMQGIGMMMGKEPIVEEEKKKMEDAREQGIRAAKAEVEAKLKPKFDRCKADKDKCHSAAFAAVDLNRNGRLEEDEIVASFTPDTAGYFKALAALGFFTEEEAMVASMFVKPIGPPVAGVALSPTDDCKHQ